MKKLLLSLQFTVFAFLCITGISYAQVGIGTTTPAYQFQIVNNGNIGASTLGESTNSGTDGVAFTARNTSTSNGYNALEAGTNGSYSGVYGLHIPATPGIGSNGVFGTSNSSDAVGVFGTVPTTGSWLGYGGLFVGGLGYANGIYNLSDASAKRDIHLIDNALESILELNGYTYKYDSEKFNPNTSNNDHIHYGFMAQNVKEFLPHAVATKSVRFPNDNKKMYSGNESYGISETLNVVDYTAITPVLVEAMKEQQNIINEQDSKIENLENKIAALEAKLNALLQNGNN